MLGISLGSGVAQDNPKVSVLALGTPFDRLDLVAHDIAWWLWPTVLLSDAYPSIDRAPSVPSNVMIMMAQQDALIGNARTQALHDAFAARPTGTLDMIILPGGHDSVWSSPQACQWLQSVGQALAEQS